MHSHPVCVVDDDLTMRESLHDLLRSAGHPVATFDSATAFLAHHCALDGHDGLLDQAL